MIARLLETAATDPEEIPQVPQDLSRRRYFGRAAPGGGRILWATPAERIVALVRACDYFPFPTPWGIASSTIDGRKLAVLKAATTGRPADAPPGTVGAVEENAVDVAAEDEWVLVSHVRPEGASAVPAAEVLAPGMRFADANESLSMSEARLR
jgi:UDP-4-amino-4-deoxy-L-arabinose formyltransferase/UDP-glucuronic acid dehydrogenase (UDP-4-keto-hexauronic acid decarboxylating)